MRKSVLMWGSGRPGPWVPWWHFGRPKIKIANLRAGESIVIQTSDKIIHEFDRNGTFELELPRQPIRAALIPQSVVNPSVFCELVTSAVQRV